MDVREHGIAGSPHNRGRGDILDHRQGRAAAGQVHGVAAGQRAGFHAGGHQAAVGAVGGRVGHRDHQRRIRRVRDVHRVVLPLVGHAQFRGGPHAGEDGRLVLVNREIGGLLGQAKNVIWSHRKGEVGGGDIRERGGARQLPGNMQLVAAASFFQQGFHVVEASGDQRDGHTDNAVGVELLAAAANAVVIAHQQLQVGRIIVRTEEEPAFIVGIDLEVIDPAAGGNDVTTEPQAIVCQVRGSLR